MKIKRLQFFLFIIFISSICCFGQQTKKPAAAPVVKAPETSAQAVRATAAYAEVLLRKTELESALEDYTTSYTEDYPKVKETRFELSLIEKDLAKLLSVGDSNLTRLTVALGKMMVRRAELGASLWSLQAKFGENHPDVARARRRVSTFEKAVGELLP